MELHKLGVKFFLRQPADLDPDELIPIYHRWIQEGALEAILIDVADYSHVPGGPGTMLISHEANYALDASDGRPGLLYMRKQPFEGADRLEDRITGAVKAAIEAGRRLENEDSLKGRIEFAGEEMVFIANDRLQAPNNEQTASALETALLGVLTAMWGQAPVTTETKTEARAPSTITARTTSPRSLSSLLKGL